MSTKMTSQLRFPEFTDEWELVALTDVISTVVDNRGKTPPITTEGIPLIETNALGSKDVHYEVIKKFVTKTTYDTWFRKYLEKGDVLFSTVGQTGVTSLYDDSTVAGVAQNIVGLRSNDLASGDFLYYLLTEPRNNNKFKQIEMIAVQPSVKVSQMIHLKFNIPSRPEQEKIADFLTAVDERIAVGEKKLELLETYKRGVMQKIFTRAVRFKDENGNPYPDWEEKKLGEVFNCVKGAGLSREQITDTGLNKCILYGELYTKYGEVIENVISRTNSNAGISSKSNDLLLPCSTTTTGIDLANATALNESDVQLGGDISILRFKKSGSNIFYAYYLSHFMKQKLASYGQGSTIVHMYFSHFKNMIVVEPSAEEQQKIANFLTTLDEKITAEKSKLTAARQFKKALLQRMFV